MHYVSVEDVKPLTNAICFVTDVITTVADGKGIKTYCIRC